MYMRTLVIRESLEGTEVQNTEILGGQKMEKWKVSHRGQEKTHKDETQLQ